MNNNVLTQIAALEKRIAELEKQLTRLQNADTVTFNQIICGELQIIDRDGTHLVTLSAHEEFESGAIKVLNKTGKVLSIIYADDEGGVVSVCSTRQRDQDQNDTGAEMHIDQNGNGYIAVFNTEGEDRASLDVAPPRLGGAGRIAVYGTVDNRERVVIGCNPETDEGSIKTYSGTWQETHSLENEPGDLRLIAPPAGDSSDLHHYRQTLEQIEEDLQNETDKSQRYFLRVKKMLLSDALSEKE